MKNKTITIIQEQLSSAKRSYTKATDGYERNFYFGSISALEALLMSLGKIEVSEMFFNEITP